MVRIHVAIDLNYDIELPSADFVLNIHCAQTARQTIVAEQLRINQRIPTQMYTDPATHARYLRLRADPGLLQIHYQATVDINHYVAPSNDINETPIAQLPLDVLTYLYPSRYCQSDCLGWLANQEFGHLPNGYQRVEAIQAWVRGQLSYQHNSSNSMTSALDTLNAKVGVCRDYAHLMIALCRALNIPARFTTGLDFGAFPVRGPTDFHAYVEVFLSHRWYLFDPSGNAIPMGFIRIGTGRDAADVSFAMIFGGVTSELPMIETSAHIDDEAGWEKPVHRKEALSTDTLCMADS